MTQRKIQSAQLSDSGVVPGPYTSANITVDAAGRVTLAANGSSSGNTIQFQQNFVDLPMSPSAVTNLSFFGSSKSGLLASTQGLDTISVEVAVGAGSTFRSSLSSTYDLSSFNFATGTTITLDNDASTGMDVNLFDTSNYPAFEVAEIYTLYCNDPNNFQNIRLVPTSGSMLVSGQPASQATLLNAHTYRLYLQEISVYAGLGVASPGSGYTDGIYPAEPLTGGSGAGATANIEVINGIVVSVVLVSAGSGYTNGDILSATLAGPGIGFSVPIYTATTNAQSQWVLDDLTDILFTFQVGVPGFGHIHHANMSRAQSDYLIHTTDSLQPVAGISQPYVLLSTEYNSNSGPGHVHILTVYFDYINHTWLVTNISNNGLDNHIASLVGTAGGSVLPLSEIGFGTGSGITSSPNLKYIQSTHSLYVNVPNINDESAEVIIRSGRNSSGWGASEILLSTAPNPTTPSDLYLSAGSGVGPGASGGFINIYGGNSTADVGGDLLLGAGNGATGGGEVAISAGSGTDGSAPGGLLTLRGGYSNGPTGNAGLISIEGGASTNGGNILVDGGDFNDTGAGIVNAGSVTLKGGKFFGSSLLGSRGGDISLISGEGPAVESQDYWGSLYFYTGVSFQRLAIKGTGDWELAGNAGTSGQVLTSNGSGTAPTWSTPAAGGGLEMNVYLLNNGTGSFGGSLISNWSSVQQRDECLVTTWGNFDSYAGSFECLVQGVYEIVVECKIVGDDGSGIWPDELSSYGVDLLADVPALNTTPQTKLHTRYSPSGFLTGNGGLTQAGVAEVALAGSTSSFTERFIVRSSVAGKVHPKLFAYSYNSSGASVSCSMSISFMKISDYTPI